MRDLGRGDGVGLGCGEFGEAWLAAHAFDGHGPGWMELARVEWLLSRSSRCGGNRQGTWLAGIRARLGRDPGARWLGAPSSPKKGSFYFFVKGDRAKTRMTPFFFPAPALIDVHEAPTSSPSIELK